MIILNFNVLTTSSDMLIDKIQSIKFSTQMTKNLGIVRILVRLVIHKLNFLIKNIVNIIEWKLFHLIRSSKLQIKISLCLFLLLLLLANKTLLFPFISLISLFLILVLGKILFLYTKFLCRMNDALNQSIIT